MYVHICMYIVVYAVDTKERTKKGLIYLFNTEIAEIINIFAN